MSFAVVRWAELKVVSSWLMKGFYLYNQNSSTMAEITPLKNQNV